jgi:hypothetical protein
MSFDNGDGGRVNDGSEDRFDRPNDPRYEAGPDYDYEKDEEFYPPEYELENTDIILLSVRCIVVAIFLVSYILFFVLVARGQRLKNWRLYAVVGLLVFSWLAMSLYQDHIDRFWVHAIYRYPQRRSIYWCFRNLVHGLSIYMTILFLSHLSDFQHRGGRWLGLVFTAILIPLVYSIALLIIDLRVQPEDRKSWEWNVAITTVKVFLYNVVTTAMLIGFSPRFCTERLYSTYEERRSPLIVQVARWTFSFLLLHNLAAMVSYGATVAITAPGLDLDAGDATIVHQAFDEAELFLMVCAVPVAYLVGLATARCCCGGGEVTDVEMAKMDKIYDVVRR